MAGRSVFIAAQTGTGKTFAYLLPLLQRLHDQEKRLGEAFKRRGQRARAIIVVPTRELAEQTFVRLFTTSIQPSWIMSSSAQLIFNPNHSHFIPSPLLSFVLVPLTSRT